MGFHIDDKLGVMPRDEFGNVFPQHRGRVNFGLRSRPLGTITIQLTAGTAGATWLYKEGTTSLHAAVTFDTNLNTTAGLIAVAINAAAATHNWVATVSTDTITLRQRRGGASGTIALTATLDAAGAPASSGNPTGDTDTWTEFNSGATFDGDLYYEIGWSGTLVLDGEIEESGIDKATALTNAMPTQVRLYCDGQAFRMWFGGLRADAAAAAIIQGIPVATATWSDWIEWLGATTPFVLKVASDEEVLCEIKYI